MILFLLILALIVAVAAVIFALQNSTMVPVTFFIWQSPEKSLALLILLAVAIGFLIGLLAILPGSVRNRWRISGLRKQMDGLKKTLLEVQAKLDQANLDITALQRPAPSSQPAASAEQPSEAPTPPPESTSTENVPPDQPPSPED